jgi:hypothetical protein
LEVRLYLQSYPAILSIPVNSSSVPSVSYAVKDAVQSAIHFSLVKVISFQTLKSLLNMFLEVRNRFLER